MRALIISLLIFAVLPSICNAKPTPLKPPCEIAVLVDGSNSVNQQDPGNFQKMIDLIKTLPDHFLIAEKESRLAVIQFGAGARVELDLTGDESKVRSLSVEYMAGSGTDTHLSLQTAKDQVFSSARENAVKIVYLITDGMSSDMKAAKEAAEALREDGVSTYVLFVGEAYKNDTKVKDNIHDIAGDPKRVSNIDNFNDMTDQFFKDLRKHIICDYEEVCQFSGTSTCENGWERRIDNGPTRNCTNRPGRPKKVCKIDGCEKECDKWWKWREAKCDNNAGKTIDINRQGPKPQRQSLDKCPITKSVTCPTTTLPSTTGRPTTFGPSTTSEGLTKTERLTTSGRSKTTGPPITSEASTIAGSTITIGLSTTSKPTTSDGGNTTVLAGVGDATKDGSNLDEKGLDWWVVFVIVLVIVCVMLAVIVVAVIVSRRKKKKAKEAKEKADAEKAAAMKKKADHEKAEKENAEKERKKAYTTGKMGKSILGVSIREPVNVSVSQRVIGAEGKILVSLRDDKTNVTAPKKSTPNVIAPKKSTGRPSQPKKSMAKSTTKSAAIAKKK